MNSIQIKANLENLKTRSAALETELEGQTDLERGLALQRDLSDLQDYRTRLETQLVEVGAGEHTAKKEREIAELDKALRRGAERARAQA